VSEVAERPTRFDELRDGDGAIRPHWRLFAKTLSQLTPEEFERRQQAARATVQDNGVTYNVYDDRSGQARPWQLDIVPFILSSQDWKTIEAAVIQRTPQLVKVCSSQFVGELVKRALPGCALTHLPVPPPAISARVDTQYFGVSKAGPCWDHIVQTRRVGIYVPGELPDPEVELLVVLES